MAELRIGCLVMAAGSGSRFGRNKLEAVVDGKSLLRRSLEAVPAEEFAQVTVVTQYDAAAALAEEFGFTVVRNDRPEDGPEPHGASGHRGHGRLRRYFVSGGGPAASGAGYRAAGARIFPDASGPYRGPGP